MGLKKDEAIKSLKSALRLRFSMVTVTGARKYSEELVDDIMQGENMESIGEAAMELQDIFEKFPDVTNVDCDHASKLLEKIEFTALPESLHAIAREQIIASLREKAPRLTEKKFIRHEPVILSSATTGKLETIEEECAVDKKSAMDVVVPNPYVPPKTFTRFQFDPKSKVK